MRHLIKLHLIPPNDNFDYVKGLPGLKGIEIDDSYGLIIISPKRNLYTIRVYGDIQPELLKSVQPEVRGVYPEARIGAAERPKQSKETE